ncbi:aspartyl protease family protein [Porphyrobacter sp. ULC335]|nr:aspartyl protease family protein [Porphyrobacter sp. ULC335]
MSNAWRSLSVFAAIAGAAFPAAASPPTQACALAADLSAGVNGDPVVDLPFRTIDGRIYLDVLVDGRGPFVFAVDTGASGIGRADASLVAELALPYDGEGQTSDGIATAKVDTVRIASLALGDLVRSDVSVIARDYRSRVSAEAAFSGILGREFFADGLLMIDFPAKRLRFFNSSELRADQSGAMAYERAFRVPVTLGSMKTTGNLDTGADVTLVIPAALYDQLQGAPLQSAGNVSLTNTRIESSAGQFAGPVQVGEATLTDVPVRVVAEFPEVLVGAHALKGQRVLIDQRHKAVAVCPSQVP